MYKEMMHIDSVLVYVHVLQQIKRGSGDHFFQIIVYLCQIFLMFSSK